MKTAEQWCMILGQLMDEADPDGDELDVQAIPIQVVAQLIRNVQQDALENDHEGVKEYRDAMVKARRERDDARCANGLSSAHHGDDLQELGIILNLPDDELQFSDCKKHEQFDQIKQKLMDRDILTVRARDVLAGLKMDHVCGPGIEPMGCTRCMSEIAFDDTLRDLRAAFPPKESS